MKNKFLIPVVSALLFSVSSAAQMTTTAQKFITYLNAYNKKELDKILSPDFKMTRLFSDVITDRKTFLGSYLSDSKTLIAKYKILEEKPGDVFLVLDQSQNLKLLDVTYPTWKMTIKTENAKVSLVTLEATDYYYNYQDELASKMEEFQTWMAENHPKVKSSELAKTEVLLKYLNTYIEFNNVKLWDLQWYDDGVLGRVEVMNDEESKKLDESLLCHNSHKYTNAQRLKFYPFNKAEKVVAISFIDPSESAEYYSKTNKITDLSIAKSSKELTATSIDSLTDILFNLGFKEEVYVKTMVETTTCPELKNAIVFLDATGKPFEIY